MKLCRKREWSKFGYGALDLAHLPASDKLLNRQTNVSGTSPKFDEGLITTMPSTSQSYVIGLLP